MNMMRRLHCAHPSRLLTLVRAQGDIALMSVLLFAAQPLPKPAPPAEETKQALGALIDDLQILAIYSPHLLDRIAKMVHRFVDHHRACLRAHLDQHLDHPVTKR